MSLTEIWWLVEQLRETHYTDLRGDRYHEIAFGPWWIGINPGLRGKLSSWSVQVAPQSMLVFHYAAPVALVEAGGGAILAGFEDRLVEALKERIAGRGERRAKPRRKTA